MSGFICFTKPECNGVVGRIPNTIPPDIVTCCLPCTDFPLAGTGQLGDCIRIDSGNQVGDIIVWDGDTWIITQPGGSTVTTLNPIVGNGSLANPVTLIDGTTCASNLQWNTLLGQWLLVEPGGATSASIGPTNGLYADVRTALSAGCTKLRIIEDVTETNASALDFASVGGVPVVIYIDPGVTWTPPPFSNTFTGVSLTIIGNSEGASSVLASPAGLSVPLFTTAGADNFVMDGVQWNGTGGIAGSRLVSEGAVIRISNSRVTLPNTSACFLGTSNASLLFNTTLSNLSIEGGGVGCNNVIVGSALSNIQASSLRFSNVFDSVGATYDVAAFSSVIVGVQCTSPSTLNFFVAGEVSNLNGTFSNVALHANAGGTKLSQLILSTMELNGNVISVSDVVTTSTVAVANLVFSSGVAITNIRSVGAVSLGASDNIKIVNLDTPSTLTVTSATNFSLQNANVNLLAGDIVTTANTVNGYYWDNVIVASDVGVDCIMQNSKLNGLFLTTTSSFRIRAASTGVDISNSRLGALIVPDVSPVGPRNYNMSGLQISSFLASALCGMVAFHMTNINCSGSFAFGGQNANTGNTLKGIRCTSFAFSNSGAFGNWSISDIVSTSTIAITGNTRNCTFTNLVCVAAMTLSCIDCTFAGIQCNNVSGFLTLSGSDNMLSDLMCSSGILISGSHNTLQGIVMGQDDTLPDLNITGNYNTIEGVTCYASNTSGISMVMSGNSNSLTNYTTGGTSANGIQRFQVIGNSNKFANIQLGTLNSVPITATSNGASTIDVAGNYLAETRIFVGQFITISGSASNNGTYRVTAVGGATTITVTPAPSVTGGASGFVVFPDVVAPPVAGNGANFGRPFGTVGNTGGSEIGRVTFGGLNNHYVNFDIIARNWFDTVLNPAPPPILIDVFRGVVLEVTSHFSLYSNVTIYKDQFHFVSPIPSPPAPNNAVVVPASFQNVIITGTFNRFVDCRIGPLATASGAPGFGTYDASAVGATGNSILGALMMLTPLGAFAGTNWIQNSYLGTDTGSVVAIGLNALF